jgi:hypothetical protein
MAIIVHSGIYCDTLPFTLTVGQLAPSDTGLYYSYWSGGPHSHCPVFSWYAIDSTQTAHPGTSLNLSDDQVVRVGLPFTFRYYGINYTRLSISSNGFVTCDSATSSYVTNYGLPGTSSPPTCIAGLWDDLDPGNSGQPSDVYYYYDAVNHRFVVEYFRVEHYSSGYHETFEIMLYDPVYWPTPTGDGEIIVQYLLAMQQADNTLGIQNSARTVGIQYYLDGAYHVLAAPVTDSFAIKYTTYPPGYVGIEEGGFADVPLQTMLQGVFPNPVHDRLRVSYQLAQAGLVKLTVYDITGRQVRALAEAYADPGYYQAIWDARDDQGRSVPAGVYFVRLETDKYCRSEKAVLMR